MPALRSPRFTRTVEGWPSLKDYTDELGNMKFNKSISLHTIKTELADIDETLLEFPSPTPSASERRHHSRKRPEGHIPRPRNAFFIYRSEFCASGKIPPGVEKHHGEISRVIGVLWNRLPPEERAVYTEKAGEEKRIHMETYPDYKYAPTTKKNSDGSKKKKEKMVKKEKGKKCDDGKDDMKHLVLSQLLIEGKEGEHLTEAYDNVKNGQNPQIPMHASVSSVKKSRLPVGRPRKAPKSSTTVTFSTNSITASPPFDVNSFMMTEMQETKFELYAHSHVYVNPGLCIPSSDSSENGSEYLDLDSSLEIPFNVNFSGDTTSGIFSSETVHPSYFSTNDSPGHINASSAATVTNTQWLNYENNGFYVEENTLVANNSYLDGYSNLNSTSNLIHNVDSLSNDAEEFREIKQEPEPYVINYDSSASQQNFNYGASFNTDFTFPNYIVNNINNIIKENSSLAVEQQLSYPSFVDSFDNLNLNSNLGHDPDSGSEYLFTDYVDMNYL